MSWMDEIDVPSYFLCPISLQLMKDPVTVLTGITYDRESIEKWLFSGKKNNTCPVTKQILPENCDLTPNHTLRRLIQAWCTMNASYGVERIPTPKPPMDKTQIGKLIRDAKTPQLQRKCLQKLRSIASESEANKRSMEAAGVVDFLASLIVNASFQGRRTPSDDGEDNDDCLEIRTRLSEEALSILYNLHISESGMKNLMGKNGEFVESLIRVMQCGTYESRAYTVYLLQSMFEVAEPLRLNSLRPEFFVEIVQVLHDKISHQALKASLQLLINLCPWGRNRVKAVEAGVVPILIELLLESTERRPCEMLLCLLDTMCGCAEGRAELLKHGAGLAVVSKKILRVSQVASERAVKILLSISKFSATPCVVQEMLHLHVVAKLCLVLQMEGNVRIKEKAREILKLHARAWKSSPCMATNLLALYPS